MPPNPSKKKNSWRGSRFRVDEFGTEPGSGKHPVAFSGCHGNAQSGRSFGHGQPAEETQLDELSTYGFLLGQLDQGLIDRQDIIAVMVGSRLRHIVEIDAPPAAAVLDAPLASR